MKCEFCNRRKARWFWEEDSIILGKNNEVSTSHVTIAHSCRECLPYIVEGIMDETDYEVYKVMNS